MTKQALVDTEIMVYHYDTQEELGYLIGDVVNSEAETFEVVDSLQWKACPDEVEASYWYYNSTTNTYHAIPQPEPDPEPPTE